VRAIQRAERGLAVSAAMVLVLLMAVVLVDVVGRNLFNRPLASGTELTELLMAVLAFLSFPLLAWRQRDITVDLVDLLAGKRLRKLQVALAGLCGAVVFGLLARQFVVFAQRAASGGDATPQLHIPMAWAWWFMAAMSALTALAAAVVAIAVFTRHPVAPNKPSEIDA
jgi:TRAP-type C4-dicarboxylate transport system permease small subunit